MPVGDERAQFELPTPRQRGQDGRELVQPHLDLTTVPRDHAPPQRVVEIRESGLTHLDAQVWAMDDHHCATRAAPEAPGDVLSFGG